MKIFVERGDLEYIKSSIELEEYDKALTVLNEILGIEEAE